MNNLYSFTKNALYKVHCHNAYFDNRQPTLSTIPVYMCFMDTSVVHHSLVCVSCCSVQRFTCSTYGEHENQQWQQVRGSVHYYQQPPSIMHQCYRCYQWHQCPILLVVSPIMHQQCQYHRVVPQCPLLLQSNRHLKCQLLLVEIFTLVLQNQFYKSYICQPTTNCVELFCTSAQVQVQLVAVSRLMLA